MVINSSDFYKMFKKENKHISKMEYEQVLDTLFSKIFSTLKEGKSYELPFKLGCFKIIKYKNNKKYIDWNNTKKLGKIVYHQNFHSDGFNYRIKWDKRKARLFKGRLIYKFKTVRWFTRDIAKGIKQNKLEFLSE